jgi:2-oxoglutarate ferredoxin oxidoreductase subunit alpha
LQKVKSKNKKELLTGSEVVVKAALASGADFFAGYPITPITEIMSAWARLAAKDKSLDFMQMEDETSSGMAVIGGLLAGRRAWTVTGGVGHVLMQDPLVLAETLQMPFVAYIGQRGGPSTGTVIYSQQELTLARFGGNGEGLRFVYAPATTQELYTLMQKAFHVAWKYRFPTLVLGDGYLSKTLTTVDTREVLPQPKIKPIFLEGEIKHLRNCFSREDELGDHLSILFKRYSYASKEVVESETYRTIDAEVVIFAWGTVGFAAKVAVANLRKKGVKAGLFRPVTLRPFDSKRAIESVKSAKKIVIAESSGGHFGRIVRETLAQATEASFIRLYKPAEGITSEEIEDKVESEVRR